MSNIDKVIERIRHSFEGSVKTYTQGNCVQFAMILKEIYPEGTILYDLNHAIFKYRDRYYDIRGELAPFEKNDNHIPIEDYGVMKAFDMMKNRNYAGKN